SGRRRGRLVVPGPLPDGATGLGRGRMGHIRARPASEVVPTDRDGIAATDGRDGNVASLRHERLEDAARQMKRSLRSWLWRVPRDQEVEEEIAFHVEMRTRELIGRGLDPQSARELALRRLGD